MHIAVVGSGYVGLVAGACLAGTGNQVVCADIDQKKIDGLNRNVMPIYEPGLHELVIRNRAQGRLSFTADVAAAVRDADLIFIAVGTPPDESGSADLNHVLKVADTIGRSMPAGGSEKVVITKSTVPVGTAAKVRAAIGAHTRRRFHVCSNPEFLKEGDAIRDFMEPDRVVVGVEEADGYAHARMAELYGTFVAPEKILFMDIASAEITKYAANAMLATRISFMNTIARLCDAVGADVDHVRAGIGSDERIGSKFLNAGIGYGGSCFPKDVQALVRTFREYEVDDRLLVSVETVNDDQKQLLVSRVKQHYASDDLTGRTFAVWGLAFKPETDDMREAPSLTVVRALCEAGAQVRGHDPKAHHEAPRHLADLLETRALVLCDDSYDCLDGADALLLLTEWSQYRGPDFDRMRALLKDPATVFDGRNIWSRHKMEEAQFRYFSIGRREVVSAAAAS